MSSPIAYDEMSQGNLRSGSSAPEEQLSQGMKEFIEVEASVK